MHRSCNNSLLCSIVWEIIYSNFLQSFILLPPTFMNKLREFWINFNKFPPRDFQRRRKRIWCRKDAMKNDKITAKSCSTSFSLLSIIVNNVPKAKNKWMRYKFSSVNLRKKWEVEHRRNYFTHSVTKKSEREASDKKIRTFPIFFSEGGQRKPSRERNASDSCVVKQRETKKSRRDAWDKNHFFAAWWMSVVRAVF